jgi:hypothetical protein
VYFCGHLVKQHSHGVNISTTTTTTTTGILVMDVIKKTFIASAIVAGVISLAGCGNSSSNGGSSRTDPVNPVDPVDPSVTSVFNFRIETPQDTLDNAQEPSDILSARSFSEALELLVGLVVPNAVAQDEPQITVAIVNFRGIVTEIVEPLESRVDDGNYYLKLPDGRRLDCIIAVNITGEADIQVGDQIDPNTGLFTPAVEVEVPFQIDLASTIAYNEFIAAAENGSNISADEVDRIIDDAQALFEETDFSGNATVASLIEAITEEVGPGVRAETQLAADTDENFPNGDSLGTYELDKAVIKDFFDDVNTIASLAGGFVVTEDETTPLEDLQTNADLAADSLESAKPALDALGVLVEQIADFCEKDCLKNAGDSTITPALEDIFGDDSGLSGSISYSQDTLNLSLSGVYAAVVDNETASVELDQLKIKVDAEGTKTDITVSISGEVSSENAVLSISEGSQLLIEGVDPNSNITDPESGELTDADIENFADSLRRLDFDLTVSLVAKDVDINLTGDQEAKFDGAISVRIVRSSNDYKESISAEDQAWYNIASASVSGGFEYEGESLTASIDLSSDNSADFVPPTIPLDQSVEYTDIITYSYNAINRFEIKSPVDRIVRTLIDDDNDNLYLTEIYKIEDGVEILDERFESFLNDSFANQFDDFIINPEVFVEGLGEFEGDPLRIQNTDGSFEPVPVFVTEVDTVIENASSFIDLDADIRLTAELAGFGVTELSATVNRTGLESGLVSLKVENTSDAAISADVNLAAIVLKGEVGEVVVSNDNGFLLKRSDIEDENADVLTFEFGLAKATVELTDAGLKVSYPRGDESDTDFDVYAASFK